MKKNETADKPTEEATEDLISEESWPRWGYRKKDGEAKLFADLKKGENLPDGYVDTPAKCDKTKDEKTG